MSTTKTSECSPLINCRLQLNIYRLFCGFPLKMDDSMTSFQCNKGFELFKSALLLIYTVFSLVAEAALALTFGLKPWACEIWCSGVAWTLADTLTISAFGWIFGIQKIVLSWLVGSNAERISKCCVELEKVCKTFTETLSKDGAMVLKRHRRHIMPWERVQYLSMWAINLISSWFHAISWALFQKYIGYPNGHEWMFWPHLCGNLITLPFLYVSH